MKFTNDDDKMNRTPNEYKNRFNVLIIRHFIFIIDFCNSKKIFSEFKKQRKSEIIS